MENLIMRETETEYIVSFKKEYLDEKDVVETIKKIQLKQLIHKIDADGETMEQLAEEIKAAWWIKNQDWIMDKVKKGEAENNR